MKTISNKTKVLSVKISIIAALLVTIFFFYQYWNDRSLPELQTVQGKLLSWNEVRERSSGVKGARKSSYWHLKISLEEYPNLEFKVPMHIYSEAFFCQDCQTEDKYAENYTRISTFATKQHPGDSVELGVDSQSWNLARAGKYPWIEIYTLSTKEQAYITHEQATLAQRARATFMFWVFIASTTITWSWVIWTFGPFKKKLKH